MKFYIVMEYLPIKLIEQTAATDDMRTLWNRIQSLTAGLLHLHQHGIFHGDLKLENLCLRDNDTIVLIDFGLSGTGPLRIKGTLNRYHPPNVKPVSCKVSQSRDVVGYGFILFGLAYLYKNFSNYSFENIPEDLIIDTSEKAKREVLIDYLEPLGKDADRIVEIIVQCTHHDTNDLPSISTVSRILHQTDDYRETQRGLEKFCDFAKIRFEERMLYRFWYKELIEAVPDDRPDLHQRLNESVIDDFPYLAVFKYVGENDIMVLAKEYRAAHPHIPLHN